jgi:hypothetical protein
VGIEAKRRSLDRVESDPLSILLASLLEYSSFCIKIFVEVRRGCGVKLIRLASKSGKKEAEQEMAAEMRGIISSCSSRVSGLP